MSSVTDAFLKYGLMRDNIQITAAEGIGRNWQHVYILRFGEATSCPYERLVHKRRLCTNVQEKLQYSFV